MFKHMCASRWSALLAALVFLGASVLWGAAPLVVSAQHNPDQLVEDTSVLQGHTEGHNCPILEHGVLRAIARGTYYANDRNELLFRSILGVICIFQGGNATTSGWIPTSRTYYERLIEARKFYQIDPTAAAAIVKASINTISKGLVPVVPKKVLCTAYMVRMKDPSCTPSIKQ